MDKIYFDIETFGNKPDESDLVVNMEDIKVPAQYKKPESIEQYIQSEYQKMLDSAPKRLDEKWRKNALDPYNCQVICIGLKVNDEPSFCLMDDNEFSLMSKFQSFLSSYHRGRYMTIGWNSLDFDVPILYLRAAKYGLKNLVMSLPRNNRDVLHVDLSRSMIPTVYNSKCSLSNACKFFGIQGKMDCMDGSKVHDLWINGEKDIISKYCASDVEPLPLIAEKLGISEPLEYKKW